MRFPRLQIPGGSVIAVVYTYADDQAAERDRVRPAHREWLAAQPNLKAAGAWSDGVGALLLFHGDSAAEVEAQLAADPFEIAGLVQHRQVKLWNPPLGSI